MDPFQRIVYLLGLNELGQITSGELRAELTELLETIKAEVTAKVVDYVEPLRPPGY